MIAFDQIKLSLLTIGGLCTLSLFNGVENATIDDETGTLVLTSLPPQCKQDCSYAVSPTVDNSGSPMAICEFINSTQQCIESLEQQMHSSPSSLIRVCDHTEFDIDIYPYYWSLNDLAVAPAVRLNISMRSMRPLSRLYITFKCLRHDSNDLRCNSSTGSPVVCRSFNFLTDERFGIADMILPLLMQYKCFNVDSYGHFQVNITLLPDQCRLRRLATRYWLPSLASLMLLHRGPFRSTYFISVPDLTKLVPEYDEWTLQGKEGSQQHNLTERARSWAPFLFVDPYSSPGAIAIRIASPPHSLAPFISNLSINVSARTGAGHKSYELHSTHVISLPNATGVFVSDLVAGDYSASCQVLWPNCSTQSPCPITSIGFWLDRDIRLPHQTPPPWIRNAALILLIFITALLAIGIIFVAVKGAMYRSRSVQGTSPMNFRWRPTLLVLYSDDFDEHTNCVRLLSHYLSTWANCHVLIDLNFITNIARSPDQWLLQAMSSADFVIVVFSEGTKLAFKGDPLPNRRHFPDLLPAGIELLLQRILNYGEPNQTNGRWASPGSFFQNVPTTDSRVHSRDPFVRFLWVTFEYSAETAVEGFLGRLPCPRFHLTQLCLNEQLARLIAHIHDVPDCQLLDCSNVSAVDCDTLKTSIAQAEHYIEVNRMWLENRRVAVDGLRKRPTAALYNASDQSATLLVRRQWQPLVDVEEAFKLLTDRLSNNNVTAGGVSSRDRFELVPPNDPNDGESLSPLPKDRHPQYALIGDIDNLSDDSD